VRRTKGRLNDENRTCVREAGLKAGAEVKPEEGKRIKASPMPRTLKAISGRGGCVFRRTWIEKGFRGKRKYIQTCIHPRRGGVNANQGNRMIQGETSLQKPGGMLPRIRLEAGRQNWRGVITTK